MTIEAELKRRTPAGALTNWTLNEDGTDPVADDVLRARAQAILDRLNSGVPIEPADLESLNSNLNAIEALLETIRDSIHRRTDVGTVRLDPEATHFVAPSVSLKVEQQRFYIATSGKMTLAGAGFFRGRLANPAGSGKALRIVRMSAFTSHGPSYVSVYKNPTTGLPATDPRPVTNAYMSSIANSVASLTADVDPTEPLGGGEETGWVFGLPGGQRATLDLPPLVMTQGTSIGLNVPFAGAADVTLSLYWFEE